MRNYEYIDSLDYDKNMFIFGEPIETRFGIIRYLTYKEYLKYLPYLSLISQNTLHLYYQFKRIYKEKGILNDEKTKTALEQMKKSSLYEIIITREEMLGAYILVAQLVLDLNEEINLEKIFGTEEDFMFFRKLIMDMNVLTEEEVSPNEEIQNAIERSRRVKQKETEQQSFVDMVTSIVASTNHSFEEVCKMTVFQVYATYARIGAIYNYHASTLFATVAEKVKVESWNKHIDLFAQESDVLTKDEFDNKFGSILGKR